jgi:hypothetical protein
VTAIGSLSSCGRPMTPQSSLSTPTQEAVRRHQGDGRGRPARPDRLRGAGRVSESGTTPGGTGRHRRGAILHAWLTDVIREIHTESRARLDSPRARTVSELAEQRRGALLLFVASGAAHVQGGAAVGSAERWTAAEQGST